MLVRWRNWLQGIKQRAGHKVTERRGEVEELPLLTGSTPVLTTKKY
jgi:hypothetical protein